MKIRPDLYATCDRCGMSIMYGDESANIALNKERVDSSREYSGGTANVFQSDVLLILCRACGELFPAELLREVLLSYVKSSRL